MLTEEYTVEAAKIRNDIMSALAAKPSWLSLMGGGSLVNGRETDDFAGMRGSSERFTPSDSADERAHKIAKLKRDVTEVMIADCRNNAVVNSGFKYVASTALVLDVSNATPPRARRLTGEEFTVATDFIGICPNAAMTTAELRDLVRVICKNSRQEGRPTCVCSAQAKRQFLREDPTIGEDFDFIEDETPLRFHGVDERGFPVLINPYSSDSFRSVNPEWVSAKNEVMALVWSGSFRRCVPESFIHSQDVRPQFAIGEMAWDEEGSRLLYQIIRAWQPEKPWACCPILSCRVTL